MASAKQLKAQKLFARRAKRGDFKKAIAKTKKAKSNLPQRITTKPKEKLYRDYAHYGAPLTGSDVGIMGESNPHNETVKFMGLEKTKKPIPDYIMAEAMNDGFEIPSGWFSMSKSMQLGFLKKFARRTY